MHPSTGRFDGRGEVGHVSPSSRPVLGAGPERGRDKPCFANQFSYKFLSAKVSYRCTLYTVARIQALLSSHSCPEGKGRAPHPEWTLSCINTIGLLSLRLPLPPPPPLYAQRWSTRYASDTLLGCPLGTVHSSLASVPPSPCRSFDPNNARSPPAPWPLNDPGKPILRLVLHIFPLPREMG